MSSVRYINTEPWSNLFQVSPSQFNVTCGLQSEEFLQLSIINSCNDCIAWKLKTNRPGRYMVSPKQGIIPSKQHNDCTVVLSKLKEIPDTKKPDKFLIQATKIDPQTKGIHLPQLWKERESRHNKKRGIYAYQSVTIKCFLTIDTKPMDKTMESKQNKQCTIIEDYVSSESGVPTPLRSKAQPVETTQQAPDAIDIAVVNVNASETDNVNNTENVCPPTKTDGTEYKIQKVEEWRRKAQEYDELFQFTRKTLAQRDELHARCKSAQEKARSLDKLNKEMKEEKKHILSKFNKYRNTHNDDDDDDDDDEYEDEDEEKRDNIEWDQRKEKNECIKEMNSIEKQALRNSSSGCSISIVHIVITVLLMYLSFIMGQHNTSQIEEIDDHDNGHDVMDNTQKHEM